LSLDHPDGTTALEAEGMGRGANLSAAPQISAVAKHVAQRNLAHDGDEALVAHGVLNLREADAFQTGKA
jgi:hypothetical protein